MSASKANNSINLILVSYHVGIQNHRVGAGPGRILDNNLIARLESLHKTVTITTIGPVDDFEGEIGRSFELIRRVSTAVSGSVENGQFPIVLAGNCNTTVGVAAGLTATTDELEVVWFDAHSDLANTDETTSGYFDGMGVSMLNGESWKALTSTVPGHRAMGLDKITFCGVRNLSESQFQKLCQSKARVIYGNCNEDTEHINFAACLEEALSEGVSKAKLECLVHVDLDCLDISIGKINEYAAPGGLDENDLLRCLDVVAARRRPVALTIASFNPHLGGGDVIAEIAVKAILGLVKNLE